MSGNTKHAFLLFFQLWGTTWADAASADCDGMACIQDDTGFVQGAATCGIDDGPDWASFFQSNVLESKETVQRHRHGLHMLDAEGSALRLRFRQEDMAVEEQLLEKFALDAEVISVLENFTEAQLRELDDCDVDEAAGASAFPAARGVNGSINMMQMLDAEQSRLFYEGLKREAQTKKVAGSPSEEEEGLVSLLAEASIQIAGIFVSPSIKTHHKAFPSVNEGRQDYPHNDALKSFSTLMLAYSVAVYYFANGSPDGHNDHGKQFMPISPGSSRDPYDYCQAAADEQPVFENVRENTFDVRMTKGDEEKSKVFHDSQASIYYWERKDDQILTLAFRGSETPEGMEALLGKNSLMDFQGDVTDVAKFVTSTSTNFYKMLKDWVGTDLSIAPADDELCGKPGMRIHTGFQEAWMHMRDNVTKRLDAMIKKAKNDHPEKDVKVFITGHSLGAALTTVAMYDLMCNPERLSGHEIFGSITFGNVIVWFGNTSLKIYQEVVPKEKRIRTAACGMWKVGDVSGTCTKCEQGPNCVEPCKLWEVACLAQKAECKAAYVMCHLASGVCKAHKKADHLYLKVKKVLFNGNKEYGSFATCDIVASSFPEIGKFQEGKNGEYGYLQPQDDFQVAWVRDDDHIFPSCFGFPRAGFCHLLDRYSQGLRRDDMFNGGLCTKISDPKDDKRLTGKAHGGDQRNYPDAHAKLPLPIKKIGDETIDGLVSKLFIGCPNKLSCITKVMYIPVKAEDMECKEADWTESSQFQGWSLCPEGYGISSFRVKKKGWGVPNASGNSSVAHVEGANCCRRKDKEVGNMTKCRDEYRSRDFTKGHTWSGCRPDEVMVGLQRGSFDNASAGKLGHMKCCHAGTSIEDPAPVEIDDVDDERGPPTPTQHSAI